MDDSPASSSLNHLLASHNKLFPLALKLINIYYVIEMLQIYAYRNANLPLNVDIISNTNLHETTNGAYTVAFGHS